MTTSAVATPPSLVAAEDRGHLIVPRRVIEKIAGQASTEVSVVGSGRRPKVVASLDGAQAWLEVEVGLGYPTPLRAAAEELRSHLKRRVEWLTGITVRRLDINVGWLDDVAELPRRLA